MGVMKHFALTLAALLLASPAIAQEHDHDHAIHTPTSQSVDIEDMMPPARPDTPETIKAVPPSGLV